SGEYHCRQQWVRRPPPLSGEAPLQQTKSVAARYSAIPVNRLPERFEQQNGRPPTAGSQPPAVTADTGPGPWPEPLPAAPESAVPAPRSEYVPASTLLRFETCLPPTVDRLPPPHRK